MHLLKKLDIDQKDIRSIDHFYWYQTAQVNVDNDATTSIQIRRRGRQGCELSPLLFNLYLEAIFREAFGDGEMKIERTGANWWKFRGRNLLLRKNAYLNYFDLFHYQFKLNINSKKYATLKEFKCCFHYHHNSCLFFFAQTYEHFFFWRTQIRYKQRLNKFNRSGIIITWRFSYRKLNDF